MKVRVRVSNWGKEVCLKAALTYLQRQPKEREVEFCLCNSIQEQNHDQEWLCYEAMSVQFY